LLLAEKQEGIEKTKINLNILKAGVLSCVFFIS